MINKEFYPTVLLVIFLITSIFILHTLVEWWEYQILLICPFDCLSVSTSHCLVYRQLVLPFDGLYLIWFLGLIWAWTYQ